MKATSKDIQLFSERLRLYMAEDRAEGWLSRYDIGHPMSGIVSILYNGRDGTALVTTDHCTFIDCDRVSTHAISSDSTDGFEPLEFDTFVVDCWLKGRGRPVGRATVDISTCDLDDLFEIGRTCLGTYYAHTEDPSEDAEEQYIYDNYDGSVYLPEGPYVAF